MRGIYTPVTKIRRQVFAEIARFAYEDRPFSELEEMPYKIIPGEVATYRDSVFRERAVIAERIRLAMGLPLRNASEYSSVSKGIDETINTRVFDRPLVNVIPFACNACDVTHYFVTNNCRGCLAHPCTAVCPVKAVSIQNGRSVIDKEKCLKCGRCHDACPYNAIVKYDRPCAAACGVDAIESDELGRAKINQDKCVACGQCLVSCPFAAIADKSEIYQVIQAIKSGANVCAAIAPAFVGQLGPMATPEKVKAALKELGFNDVVEVALGADIGAIAEAHHYVHKVVPKEQPFLATSCCPSWSVMAKRDFPDLAPYVSESDTPMIAAAKVVKERNPDAKVVFIGPCVAKKLEAQRKIVRGYVDYVITFEELMGMLVAKGVEFGDVEAVEMNDASGDGRGYAVAGGVADAISRNIKALYPDQEVLVDRAEGLRDCKKMLMLAKAGKRNGYLLEGMACPGGCIGGAGTLMPPNKATVAVKNFTKASSMSLAKDNTLAVEMVGELGEDEH